VSENFFGMSEGEIIKTADILAGRTDKNSPVLAGTPQELFARVEQGFDSLVQEGGFMSYMDIKAEI